MNRQELTERVIKIKSQTHDALQLLWDNINKGQRKQLLKNPEILAILDRYNVDHE